MNLEAFHHRIQEMHRRIAFHYPLHERKKHHARLQDHFSGISSKKLDKAELDYARSFLNGLYFDLTLLVNTKKQFFKAFPLQETPDAKLSVHANEIALHQLQAVLVKAKRKLKVKTSKKKKSKK